MLGQPPDFRLQFFARVQEAAARQDLPADAVVFAEARRRQAEVDLRYKTHTPTQPKLRDQISRLIKDDQAVRDKAGFDIKKMEAADRRTAGPLKAIFDRHGVPTFDMVGVQAAKDFVVMVQHQAPAFREAVLPKLKANVDAGQAEPGRTRRSTTAPNAISARTSSTARISSVRAARRWTRRRWTTRATSTRAGLRWG